MDYLVGWGWWMATDMRRLLWVVSLNLPGGDDEFTVIIIDTV